MVRLSLHFWPILRSLDAANLKQLEKDKLFFDLSNHLSVFPFPPNQTWKELMQSTQNCASDTLEI